MLVLSILPEGAFHHSCLSMQVLMHFTIYYDPYVEDAQQDAISSHAQNTAVLLFRRRCGAQGIENFDDFCYETLHDCHDHDSDDRRINHMHGPLDGGGGQEQSARGHILVARSNWSPSNS